MCSNKTLLTKSTVGQNWPVGYYSLVKQWQPTPVLLPGKSHGWSSLVGCSPWGREELDTTARLHCHFSLSCIGEGNGNPLWCSCLENPRDGGAWWAAISGVGQSQRRLKRLSSSNLYSRSWTSTRKVENWYDCSSAVDVYWTGQETTKTEESPLRPLQPPRQPAITFTYKKRQ